jgi:hypothetical protein
VSWVRQGPNFYDPRHIWAQKFSDSGAPLWPSTHVRVFDGASLQFGNFPTFVTDGAGGAVFRWYSSSPLQCYAQRILADGSEAFAHNGVSASTDTTRTRVSPDASFNQTTGEIFLFWTEMNSLQSQWGVYGQRIGADGSRKWSETGMVFRPVGGTPMGMVSTLPSGEGALLVYAEALATGNDHLLATRLDGDGNAVWSDGTVTVSSVASDKSSLDVESSSRGITLLAWTDQRSGDRDIYAQNLNEDGSLGRGCELALAGAGPTMLDFAAPFHVATGLISDVAAGAGYGAASCAGYFAASPAEDPSEDPASGEGRYYLARGTDRCLSYGDSSLDPDPRDDLDAGDPCP